MDLTRGYSICDSVSYWMQTLLKRYCLSLLLLALSLFNIVMAGEYAENNNQALKQNTYQTVACDIDYSCETNILTEKMAVNIESFDDGGFTRSDYESSYYISLINRIVSHDNLASQGVEPAYHLLISFLSPPLLDIALTTVTLPHALSHWTNTIAKTSRLSGWKDSNALYTHQHSRSL